MNVLNKVKNRIVIYIRTLMVKLKHKGLSVDGFFFGRKDTQMIIQDNGKLKLGKNVSFQRNVSLTSVCDGTLMIGSNVSFNRNCIVICRKSINIEDCVIFGPGVTIYDHDHKFSIEGIEKGFNNGSVVIEKGCWIGANVIILRNTHIGEGSIIGAGSIVQGNIPSHSLVTSERKLNIVSIEKK